MKYKQTGSEVRFNFCPICNKKKKENPCFSVNLKKMKYVCFTTGQGGNISDLNNFDFNFETLGPIIETEEVDKKDFREILYSSTSIEKNKKWIEYFSTRGITTPKIYNKVRIYNNNLMIPITTGEDITAIKYRSVDKKLWCEKGSKADYFINWQNIEDFSNLIIVEGEIDLFSCIEAGFDSVVSIPLGVKNLKCITTQIEWIKKFKKIIIATDNDGPGIDCKNEISEMLSEIKEKLFEIDLEEYKDLNEVLVKEGKEKVKKILKNSKKIFDNYEPFFEMDGGYFTKTSKGIQQITDFTIEITGFSDSVIKGIAKENDRTREFQVLKSEVISKEGFVRNIGFFLGGATKIINFLHWILKNNQDKYLKEIDYYGFVEDGFYHSGSEVICNKHDLKINSIDDIRDITKEDLEWLNKNLIYLRSDVNQSLIGLSWALGRFYNHEQYPLLEVAGTTSIGKTEYVEFISRIMFGNKENIKSFTTLTNHQIRSISSCSNITCWVIDEVKITGKNLKERAIELYSTIRAVYDNKTLSQGNTSNKLTEFKLKTPLIVSGESELSDVSVKNRMISVKLSPGNKSEEEIFLKLKETDILEKFSKYALEKRMKNKELIITNTEVRKFLSDVKDERQIFNGKCILVGFKFLCNLIKIQDNIKKEFIKYLNTLLSNSYSTEENFKQLLDLVLEGGLPYGDFYIKNDNIHCCRFNMLYKSISEEHQKTNSTLELVDAKTLRNQLIECGFIEQKNIAKRINIWNDKGPTKIDIFKIPVTGNQKKTDL